MAGGGLVLIGGSNTRRENQAAEVIDKALCVHVVNQSGGGPTANVNIVSPLPLPISIDAQTVDVSIDDGGNSITIDDGGLSITVDGAVDVSGSTVTIQEPLSVDDNGGSLTVDDGGASLTVDGTVAVSSLPTPVDIDIAAQTVDVEVVQPTHDDLNCNANVQQGNTDVGVLAPLAIANTDPTSGLQAQVFIDGAFGFRALFVSSAVRVDDAAGAIDPAFPAGVLRDDVLSTVGPADGDYTNMRVDSRGALWVRPSMTNESISVAPLGQTVQVGGVSTNLHVNGVGDTGLVSLYCSNPNAADETLSIQLGSGVNISVFCPAGETVPALESHFIGASRTVSALTLGASNVQVFGDFERIS